VLARNKLHFELCFVTAQELDRLRVGPCSAEGCLRGENKTPTQQMSGCCGPRALAMTSFEIVLTFPPREMEIAPQPYALASV
jgi:hypothetical protein